MYNNQELGLRLGNDVGLVGVKDFMINGIKWNNLEQFDHNDDHDDIHLQVVPDLHQDDEILNKDTNQEIGNESLVVPDEHSETGDHHHQHHHDHIYYSNDHNKKEKQLKRRRRSVHQILMTSSDEESSDSGFTREVPSVTRKVCKRRRRRRKEMMSPKILKLQQLLPNSHKRDEVAVLDNAIDYMKDLRLQIQFMSMMGLNPYMASPYPYGMHNHPSTALTISHGQIPANQATSSPFIPASNWPLTPLTSLSSYSFSSHCPNGLVPCFPSFMDHIGRF